MHYTGMVHELRCYIEKLKGSFLISRTVAILRLELEEEGKVTVKHRAFRTHRLKGQ